MSKKVESNVILVSDVERPMDKRAACVCITNVIILCTTAILVMLIWGEYQMKALKMLNDDYRSHGNLRGISYR